MFLGFVAFAYRYSTFRITKNFEEVDPGRFYRSAQLTPEEMEEAIKKYGIKTVVSLRGAPEHAPWYQPQVDVLEKNGVKFEKLWWTAEHFPAKEELIRFEDILEKGDYPILVHCRAGSDRTGEATAIYAINHMKLTNEQAVAKHLNFDYWHVETFKPAMKEFVRRYQGPTWAREVFEPCSAENRPWVEAHHCISSDASAKTAGEASVDTASVVKSETREPAKN
ncbi:MAG: tyrosine-protein phosphatase [Bdellovibrionaceae bacterium]|nr:tyrosine-protein phosphatase [Pseudobdellovibrionaceae bacterium]